MVSITGGGRGGSVLTVGRSHGFHAWNFTIGSLQASIVFVPPAWAYTRVHVSFFPLGQPEVSGAVMSFRSLMDSMRLFRWPVTMIFNNNQESEGFLLGRTRLNSLCRGLRFAHQHSNYSSSRH
jgi:hypothetical protein